jgi:hypothetical protein
MKIRDKARPASIYNNFVLVSAIIFLTQYVIIIRFEYRLFLLKIKGLLYQSKITHMFNQSFHISFQFINGV